MARILIVEDEEAIRLVTSMHLSLVGYEVLEAEDAPCARALLASCPMPTAWRSCWR